jgi:ribose transport system permease protein
VTDLAYGVILVLSLLLTLALPRIQVWMRHVSPLLVFVVLGLLFAGVGLHATFDYSGLAAPPSSAPASTAAPTQSPMPESPAADIGVAADELSFEPPERGPTFVRSPFATEVAQLAILLIAVFVILRVVVWQAGKRAMTPLIYIALAGLIVVGAWLLIDTAGFVPKPGN